MTHQIVLVLTVLAAGCCADYHSEFTRPSYVTPSPSPSYSPSASYLATAEPKSYSEDDRRPFSDGPGHSHPRTGPPPKKLGPGPAPLSFASGAVPLTYPQRLVPAGSIIGYLAYPQPLAPLHDTAPAAGPGLLPSAAFSHIAYAAPVPVPVQHYRPLVPGSAPSYTPPSYTPYNH